MCVQAWDSRNQETEITAIGNSISTGQYLGTSNAEELVFKTNATEGFRLTTDGKIIVGGLPVGLPAAKLTVNGNVLATGSIVADGISVANFVRSDKGVLLQNVFCFEGNDGTPGSANRMWSMNGDLLIQSHNAYDYNTILNNSNTGNVGIGTATPQEKLDVDGNVVLRNRVMLKNLDPANGTESIVFIDNNGDLKIGDADAIGDILYESKACPAGDILSPQWANGTNKIFSECPQVFVGVGTNSPNHKLDVRGYGSFSQGIKLGLIYTNPSGNDGHIEGYSLLTSQRPWINFVAKDIGEDHTVFLVNKDGGLYCTSARVRIKSDIPIPDYVFQDDYDLMPLEDVKAYIEQNCHLPNIPSEAEIRKEGLSLEEMQLKLLEKVEQLTLYVLDLEEQSKEQQKRIEALTDQLNENH